MKRLLPFALILLAAILIALFLRDVVREVIVLPLLYFFWIVRFFINAIPQSMMWGFFVTIFVIILILNLLPKRKPKSASIRVGADETGRIEDWVELLTKAQREAYFKWRLAQRLQKTTLTAVAHQNNQTLKQTRQQLRRGELDLPPRLQRYFLAGLRPLAHLSPVNRLFRSKTSTPPDLEIDPMEVVQYLQSLSGETALNMPEITLDTNTKMEQRTNHEFHE